LIDTVELLHPMSITTVQKNYFQFLWKINPIKRGTVQRQSTFTFNLKSRFLNPIPDEEKNQELLNPVLMKRNA